MSSYGGAPLFSFHFGVQFNVADVLRPVCAYVFSEMSPLENVDCIFQIFGEAVVGEYTCNICIESSDFDCVADFVLL